MSHILGRREFWSLEFQVTPDVLTPRPDSETLIEAVLDRIKDRSRGVRIADLGVGSGCLLLALLNELPNATGLGIDRSPAALVVARENAKQLGLAARAEWREGDWLHGVSERFDVIVSNPPYIASGTLAALEPELRYEPRAALDGGLDGLDAYRTSAPMLAAALSADGIVALEIGHDQGDAVAAILEQAGLDVRARRADLSGRERCLVAAASLR
jgi:release factor glutamine methyltransferase